MILAGERNTGEEKQMTVDVKSWNNKSLDPGKLPKPWSGEVVDSLAGTCHRCTWVVIRGKWFRKFTYQGCDVHGYL